ncbi:histidinol-phosphate transaminase activity [Vibrio sp. B1ASS3]|uniref:aminotransferase class I/II-fold pyridoxal phosphate-dependent enzyme n=1 Tax=Vibrio sp. B1ASS3 TaxID=2751176 RepID=UPI001ABA1D40|nr:aminotransferase class I/II-fold pyridoxal phosphate-dependent enzyme [Vibrio sp. B1ASS3]CAD7804733.1 histidinol-phosphate transaminase activity [Vibrio sp. B1ASS3]CAE6897877.1 histidinol-phosphate transaminase activity [Vibrio sp. B1ASS3]
MDRCESFWDWEKSFKNEVLEELSLIPWNRYDEILRQEEKTKEVISSFLNLKPTNITLMCGGFDAIQKFINLRRGEIIAIPNNSFFAYKSLAKNLGVNVIELNHEDLFNSTLPKIICTPDNPSGYRIEDQEIIDCCDFTSPVLIDKTYFYFNFLPQDKPVYIRKNLITNISLSKSFSMAGVRASFLIGDEENINELDKTKAPFHIPIMTSIVIRKLFDEDWVRCFREKSHELSKLRHDATYLLKGLKYNDPNSNYLSINKGQCVPDDIVTQSREMYDFYRLTLGNFNEK